MRLQLALDMLHTDEALRILELTAEYVDIIEIGTPLLKHEGVSVVKKIKELYPLHEIMVDMKTMDVGEYEANFGFKAGGDIVTVLGCADDDTIIGTIKSAFKNCKKSQVDLINVDSKLERGTWAHRQDADFIGIHTGIDQQLQGETPFETLRELCKVIPTRQISVAGGINLETFPKILTYRPGIIVVGGAITNAEDPIYVASKMRNMLNVVLNPPVLEDRNPFIIMWSNFCVWLENLFEKTHTK